MASTSIPSDLSKCTIKDLRALAKDHDVKIASKMRKAEIVEILEEELQQAPSALS